MSLPTFSEAIKKASFIKGVKGYPTLRIDEVDTADGKVYCHLDDTSQDPGRIILKIAEINTTTVRLYQLNPLEFQADIVK